MAVLTMWIMYAAFGVTLFAMVFLWAVRTGQFRDQERARHMVLRDPPAESGDTARSQEVDERGDNAGD